ncbi:SDR family NAD(P)-dependent oxidoreductase [Rhodococcus sp. 3Y1]
MTDRFEGRRALVTGSSRGIGAGVAERLAAEGADVASWPGRSVHATLPGSLEETAARIAKYGNKVEIVVADLTDEQQRDTVVPLAIEKLGGTIDIRVNNAAAAIYQPLSDYPLRRRRLMFEANVHAPLDLMQAVVPGMVANGYGWIVNVSSGTVKPWHGPPFTWVEPGTAMTVYGASKAALNRMSNGMGVELYGQGFASTRFNRGQRCSVRAPESWSVRLSGRIRSNLWKKWWKRSQRCVIATPSSPRARASAWT